MYFLNSGSVEVSTKKGFHAVLKQGDFFGEGAFVDLAGLPGAL
jgi:CRP-like cAMP-binding protein